MNIPEYPRFKKCRLIDLSISNIDSTIYRKQQFALYRDFKVLTGAVNDGNHTHLMARVAFRVSNIGFNC